MSAPFEQQDIPVAGGRPVTLTEASAGEAQECADLLGTALVYRGPEEIRRIVDGGGLVLRAVSGGVLVGVGTAEVVSDLRLVVPPGVEDVAARYDGYRRIGVVRQLVVLPQARGHGVATAIVGRQLSWMREAGVQVAVSDAWVYPDGHVPASRPLLANGFRRQVRVPDFWRHDPRTLELGCTVCGPTCSCSCSADIFEAVL